MKIRIEWGFVWGMLMSVAIGIMAWGLLAAREKMASMEQRIITCERFQALAEEIVATCRDKCK